MFHKDFKSFSPLSYVKRIYWILLFLAALFAAHLLNSGGTHQKTCDMNAFSPVLRRHYPIVQNAAASVCPLRTLAVRGGIQLYYSVDSSPDLNAVLSALRRGGARVVRAIHGKEWFVMADYNGTPISVYYSRDKNAIIVFISARTSSS